MNKREFISVIVATFDLAVAMSFIWEALTTNILINEHPTKVFEWWIPASIVLCLLANGLLILWNMLEAE